MGNSSRYEYIKRTSLRETGNPSENVYVLNACFQKDNPKTDHGSLTVFRTNLRNQRGYVMTISLMFSQKYMQKLFAVSFRHAQHFL